MRVAILVLSILGGLSSTVLGHYWLLDYYKYRDAIDRNRPFVARLGNAQFTATVAEFDLRTKTFPFLLAGALLGMTGGVLATQNFRRCAAVLLFTSAVGPGVLLPMTLHFTAPLLFGAVLCLQFGPRPCGATRAAWTGEARQPSQIPIAVAWMVGVYLICLGSVKLGVLDPEPAMRAAG
jgi:hypothetical protein